MSSSFIECRCNDVTLKKEITNSPFMEILRAITRYGCKANIVSWKAYRESDNGFDIAFEFSKEGINDLICIDIFSSAKIIDEVYFKLEIGAIELIGYSDLSGKNGWQDELFDITEEKITVYDAPSKMITGKLNFCRIFDPVIGKSVCCQSEQSYWANQEICKRMVYSRRKISKFGLNFF